MKRIGLFLLLIGAFTFTQAQLFEGKITVTTSSVPEPMVYQVKDNRVLISEGTLQGREDIRMIVDYDAQTFLMLTTRSGMRKALKFDFQDNPKGILLNPMAPLQVEPPKMDKNSKPVFAKTKEMKVFDGQTAHKYTFETDHEQGQAWILDDSPILYQQLIPVLRLSGNPQNADIQSLEGFVVDLTSTDKETGKTFTYKASFEQMPLDAALFQLPESARIIDMSSMMRRIQDANNDPEKLQKIMEELN